MRARIWSRWPAGCSAWSASSHRSNRPAPRREQRLQRAKTGLGEAEQKVAAQKEAIGALENRITALRAERDQRKETLALRPASSLPSAGRRWRSSTADSGRWSAGAPRSAELLGQRQQEVEVWTEQVADLTREAATQMARAAEIVRTLAIAQESVEKIRGELVELEQQMTGA